MARTFILACVCFNGLVATAQQIDQNRSLTKDYQANRLEQATTSLVATNVVGIHTWVEYKAGQSVVLMPGFEAKSGSVFTAYTGAVSLLAASEQPEWVSMTTSPNPFDEVITITYVLIRPARTSLFISDGEGKLLSRLVDGHEQTAGRHQVEWRGGDLLSGTYICTLDVGGQRLSRRIIRK